MIFVSYAVNCEDVLIWRALRDISPGFYIDAGASDPDAGSVTRAFYDRGWSGVNVAPTPAAAARFAALRPRDTNLARGALAGLDALFAGKTVHVLRASWADARQAIGAGCRPWIVLIMEAAGAAPDEALAGYRAVWFDGCTRFYVDDDHAAGLAPAFALPVNAADNFVRAADSDLAPRVASLERALAVAQGEAATAAARAQGGAQRLLDAVRAAGALQIVADERAETVAWLRGLTGEALAVERRLRAESDWYRAQLDEQRRLAEDRGSQLDARAAELAWLRGLLQDSQAALEATRQDAARLNTLLQAAVAEGDRRADSAAAAAQAMQAELLDLQRAHLALQTTLSWRITAPLRFVRRGLRGSPAEAPVAPAAVPPPPAPPAAEPEAPAAPTQTAPEPAASPEIHDPAPAPQPPPPEQPESPPERAPESPPQTAPQTAPKSEPQSVPPPAPPASDPPPRPAPPQPLHAVHQFHPDASAGDAITNAMIGLRATLRAMGYDSDIFVERRGPGLGDDLRLIDAIPRHSGYVLLAHHSMGYAGFARIIALPAPKVLIYHNITPPELLQQTPRQQSNAILGRTQLAAWRDHAIAALADSEFNATELRRLGFGAVRTCTLLFDLDALRRRAAAGPARAPGAPFTILFVGRVTPSKAQDDLIAAYARFRARTAAPSRLVLAGALDPAEARYLDRLNGMILDHDLADHVLITGLVPDDELQFWYAQADLYVSLSHHEGFGVPLVEAMAHGVPVLAWPAGAIPYTLGGAGVLLASREPDDVAGQMLALAQDPARRAAIAAQQTASLPRFAPDRHHPLLQQALALAGAQPPPDPAVKAVLAATMRVAIAGHVNGSYSLAAVNRTLAACFEAARPGAVRLIPVEGDPTTRLDGVPAAERRLVDALAQRTQAVTGPEVVISQHYPVYVPEQRGDLTLALVFWEESLLPAATVAVLNGFDGVLAPSAFVARLLVDSGVAAPVINTGLAPPLAPYAALARRPDAPHPFRFLHVSSAFPRKGIDALLTAWQRAFRHTDPVCLVIKSFPNPHHDIAAQIARLQADDPALAPIRLIDEDLGPAAHLALFAESDAMVLPARGEGYNLAAAEAMAAGLRLIVTDRGGHRDFCGPATARLVRSRPAPSRSHLATPHSLWREPDVDDLAAALREVAAGTPPATIAAARAAIAAVADPAAMVNRVTRAAATLLLARPLPPARIAWVTSWGVRCGVAGYARALLEAMPASGARQAVLCDDRTPGGETVVPCWSLDPAQGIGPLVDAVLAEDADVVLVQHQPGLLDWGRLAGLVPALVRERRAVVVTLHNTAHLLTIPAAQREPAVAALAQAARVLVHSMADLDRLEPLGLQPVLLPHGAPAGAAARAARALPPDSRPVIGCYGFFLPGKGIGTLIEAAAALRGRWSGLRLVLVNAAYGDDGSAAEIAACRALAEAARLDVAWHLDFLPDAQSAALLAGCDVIALPYAPSLESSSAALRSALATGVPVAVTPIALFDEAGDAVARLPGGDVEAVTAGLAALLADTGARARLAEAANAWLADHAVPGIARRLHGMLCGLAAQRRLGWPLDGTMLP